MTSYATANESSVSPTSASTVSSSFVDANEQKPIPENISHISNVDIVATLSKQNNTTLPQGQHVQHLQNQQEHQQHDDCEEREEKADSTPENIKKIDDIIEFEHQKKQQQQQQEQKLENPSSHMNNVSTSAVKMGETVTLGLAIAIDDSNAKLCFAKKPPPTAVAASALLTSYFPFSYRSRSLSSTSSLCNEKESICNSAKDTKPPTEPVKPQLEQQEQQSNENTNSCSLDDSSTSSNIITTTNSKIPTGAVKTKSSSATENHDNGKRACTFTFNFDNVDSNAATTAAKYKSVMERFQNRHRRGASMSKLDSAEGGKDGAMMTTSLTGDNLSSNNSSSTSATMQMALRNSIGISKVIQNSETQTETLDDQTVSVSKVKLRARDRSTSRVRDAAKRHSWSPRSSTNELTVAPTLPTKSRGGDALRPRTSTRRTSTLATINSSANKSKPPPPSVMSKGNINLIANRTQQFTPRSTVMQLALQKIDMLCPQAPLGDFTRDHHNNNDEGDADDVSEAGTYTLDGDKYTEEEKDLMNIDKNARHARRQNQKHEREQNLQGLVYIPISSTSPLKNDIAGTKIPIRTSNVLEINYFHNEEDDLALHHDDFYDSVGNSTKNVDLDKNSSAVAYLGKIRSRVQNLPSNVGKNIENFRSSTSSALSPTSPTITAGIASMAIATTSTTKTNNDEDIGCFTSVTTSGVLAKQSTLDHRPKLTRNNSLTTSQIDSSEYISNEVKLKNAPTTNVRGGYTDRQKAEYRLNLFTNQKDSQKYATTRNLIETPPETPVATTSTDKFSSDTAALTMAQNKNDWIQQWARNARARSLASETTCAGNPQQQEYQQHMKTNMMTRSYNCGGTSGNGGGGGGGSLTDDSLYGQTFNQRYRLPGASDNEYDYSSDPSLLTSVVYGKELGSPNSVKPPKSPSKIPSPLHSIGRTRSASRTRGSLQGLLAAQDDECDEDIYLHKTAAAISNLEQSISRKNSIKSPTDSVTSPRMHATLNSQMEDGDSPLHSIESDGYRSHRHRRNLSTDTFNATAAVAAAQAQLMTSSFNEQQLQLLTSGEYLMKQMRMRKNSFDGNISSPRRRVERAPEIPQQQQHKHTTISPLHRTGSFSMKTATAGNQPQQRCLRPQYQNIYTPPAARQGGIQLTLAGGQQQRALQVAIKKSASSNNFGQAYSDYDDHLEYYINDADEDLALDIGDDEEDEIYSDYDEYGNGIDDYGPRTITLRTTNFSAEDTTALAPLSSTRYNKALLMRIERSKQRVTCTNNYGNISSNHNIHNKSTSAPSAAKHAMNNIAGLVACPNTPELPRRNVRSAPRAGVKNGIGGARQSVPRETSLSRLASQVPNSLASAKRQLLQTAAAGMPTSNRSSSTSTANATGQRVQPKYMDISRYKPAQGNVFLRKNEAKSTLKAPALDGGMKRSPSSSGLSRNDPARASNRSIRSVMTTSCTGAIGGGSGSNISNISRASSAVRRDDSVLKQKEIEMAMWKRRSTYDPLKAAAEDRRRKEEAKRLAMAKNEGEALCERQSRSHTRRGQF